MMVLVGCLFFNGFVVAATSADYTVTYKNQQGSTLTLTWHPEKSNTGTLSGMFGGQGGGCKQASGVPASVSGVFMGNALAMTVRYFKCEKVIAITGNLKNGNKELQLQWLTAMNSRDVMRLGVDTNQVGTDTYVKVAS